MGNQREGKLLLGYTPITPTLGHRLRYRRRVEVLASSEHGDGSVRSRVRAPAQRCHVRHDQREEGCSKHHMRF